MRLRMIGLACLALLFGKFSFGITNLSSHIMHLAAVKWSLKFDLGFMTSIMQNQASISFVVVKSSKKLTGKLPLNHFSN